MHNFKLRLFDFAKKQRYNDHMDMMLDVVYRPHHYIELIIAVFMLLTGLYIGGPWYLPTAGYGDVNPGLYATLVAETSRYVFAALFILSSVLMFTGKLRGSRRWIQLGLYSSFMTCVFTVILYLAVNGLRPLNWLSLLSVGLIAGVLWVRLKWEDKLRP